MQGPLGEFRIPESPETTREHVRVLTELVFGGEYDHPELPTDVRSIVDIGAGWGAFAVWARAKWPAASVDCYDPHDEATRYLVQNAPWATLHPVAVSSAPNPKYAVDWEWGSGRIINIGDRGDVVASVHPKALPACDVLKCDAEGIEPDVVANYPYIESLKALIYEFHSPEHRAALREMCTARGLRNLREDDSEYGTAIWVP